MSLAALLRARNILLLAWSFTTFNNVLKRADKMYLRALNNGLVDLGPIVKIFFSIAKLPTIVTVSNSCIRIHACSPIKNSGINLPVDV